MRNHIKLKPLHSNKSNPSLPNTPFTNFPTKMSACGVLFSLLLLLLFFTLSGVRLAHAHGFAAENGTVAMEAEMVPLMEEGRAEMVVELNETRRRLGSFQVCALCTCCGGAKGYCLPSPCCYAINCNIPNRPFGFCSFTPKTCNCLGCHL